MGFMDKVKAQATVLADKAQTGVQQGQSKFQEMQSGKQEDHLLRELGAYVFLSERNRNQPDSETKVAEIMSQIDALEAAGIIVTVTAEPVPGPAAGVVPPSSTVVDATQVPPTAAPPAPIKQKVVQGDLFDTGPMLATAVERIGLPAPLRAQLDPSELAALGCVFANQNARISDIAQALRRPPARVPGLMSRLVGKLHAGGFPCLRRQALTDGEDQYVYVRQGTERP